MKGLYFLILLATSTILVAQQQPNIVFILADDCTSWDIGVYGNKDSKTPTIDKLASEGMRFDKCYQSAPMCSPTRHNLLTGLYPTVSGAYPNHTNVNGNIQSVGHYLAPLGYRVALSGKQHYGPEGNFPMEYLGNSKGKNKDPDFEAVDAFLKETKKQATPFCLFLMSNQPHTPWNLGDKTLFDKDSVQLPPFYADTPLTRSNYVDYLAEINYLDGQVEEALKVLDKYNLSDNTIVVFASEQGNAFPFAKWTCYNAGLKSALIVKWPGKVKPGSVSNALVEYSDLLPTFIEVAGGDIVNQLDGSSLVPVLTNAKNDHKEFTYAQMTTRGISYGSEYYPIRSINNGEYRYILNLTPEIEFSNWVHGTPFFKEWEKDARSNEKTRTLINKYNYRPAEELYNDETDPFNQHDLSNDPKFAHIKEKLKSQLKKWMLEKGDKGLISELLAFEHMPKKRSGYEVLLDTVLHKSKPKDSEQSVNATFDGYYTFYLNGSGKIEIDGKVVVAQNLKAKKDDERYGIIGLKKGTHDISITGIDAHKVKYSGPKTRKQTVLNTHTKK